MANGADTDTWKRAEFRRTWRGYRPAAVDEALAAAGQRIELLSRENRGLTARVNELLDRLSVHEERAQAAQEALITARTVRRKTLDAAAAEAEALRARARDESAQVMQEARDLERQAQLEREEGATELEELRRTVETEAREEADRIRGEARAEAARRTEQADREITTLTAQLERLESRRSEFVDFVVRELGDEVPAKRERARRKSQPLDIRFRRPGEESATASSVELSVDG